MGTHRRRSVYDEPQSANGSSEVDHSSLECRVTEIGREGLRGLRRPLDVKLSELDIVQPDVFIVCEPDQVKETHIDGSPTIIVEVLSPSSLRHDRIRKLSLYAKFGVQEYWIVNPEPAMVEVLTLSGDGSYRVAGVYSDRNKIASEVLPELEFDAEVVFGPPVDYPDEVKETPPPMAETYH